MRILHLNQYGVTVGGVEGYIAEVSAALASEGHQSHLVHFSESRTGKRLPIRCTYVRLPAWPASIDTARDPLMSLIEVYRPDVVYAHVTHHPEMVRWLGSLLPVVTYIHSPYVVCPGFAQYLRRSRRACPHGAGMICLANAVIENCCYGRHPRTLVNHLRRARTFIDVLRQIPAIVVAGRYMESLLLRNGLAHDNLLRLPPVLLPATRRVCTAPSSFERILYAGRVSEEKGLPQLLHALVGVDRPWRLIVAGAGEILTECVQLAQRLGLGERVDFIGWVDEAQMDRLYRDSSFLVVPSLWPEPYGRVGPQAMANGRPVIAFDGGGVRDWLRDGKNGILVPANDVKHLQKAIETLLGSPDLQEAMGVEAYANAARRWSSSEHVARLVGIFSEVIKQQPKTEVAAR